MKIHYEELEELVYNPIKKELIDQHRWYNNFAYIVEYKGKFYQFFIMESSSEIQEGQFTPAERFNADKDGMVECIEVEEIEVMTIQWVVKH